MIALGIGIGVGFSRSQGGGVTPQPGYVFLRALSGGEHLILSALNVDGTRSKLQAKEA